MTDPVEKHGKICYMVIPSDDPEASGTFYSRVFHWSTRQRDDGSHAFDDSTGQVSGTWETGLPPAATGLAVHIMVDNIDATSDAIEAAGGRIVNRHVHGPDLWNEFLDPYGNKLCIYEYRPEQEE